MSAWLVSPALNVSIGRAIDDPAGHAGRVLQSSGHLSNQAATLSREIENFLAALRGRTKSGAAA